MIMMMMMYSSKVYDSICFLWGLKKWDSECFEETNFFHAWRLAETPQTFLALVAYVVVISCIKPGKHHGPMAITLFWMASLRGVHPLGSQRDMGLDDCDMTV